MEKRVFAENEGRMKKVDAKIGSIEELMSRFKCEMIGQE